VNEDHYQPFKFFETLVQLLIFAVIGVAATYWLSDSLFISVALGLGMYLLFSLFVMVIEVVQIRRELAVFKNGAETPQE
jgi:hypothetical protein